MDQDRTPTLQKITREELSQLREGLDARPVQQRLRKLQSLSREPQSRSPPAAGSNNSPALPIQVRYRGFHEFEGPKKSPSGRIKKDYSKNHPGEAPAPRLKRVKSFEQFEDPEARRPVKPCCSNFPRGRRAMLGEPVMLPFSPPYLELQPMFVWGPPPFFP